MNNENQKQEIWEKELDFKWGVWGSQDFRDEENKQEIKSFICQLIQQAYKNGYDARATEEIEMYDRKVFEEMLKKRSEKKRQEIEKIRNDFLWQHFQILPRS